MIVSESKNFIFFRTPKTASSTLTAALMPYATKDKLAYSMNISAHTTYGEFVSHPERVEIAEKAYKFCFVRNPYDRIFSGFMERFRLQPEDKVKGMYEKFVLEYLPEEDPEDMLIFKSQKHWTHYNGAQVVDFIGKVEDFDADVQKLRDTLGIDIDIARNLNVRREGEGHKYQDFYTAEMYGRINALYREEFEMYGYEVLG